MFDIFDAPSVLDAPRPQRTIGDDIALGEAKRQLQLRHNAESSAASRWNQYSMVDGLALADRRYALARAAEHSKLAEAIAARLESL